MSDSLHEHKHVYFVKSNKKFFVAQEELIFAIP
jgi:hypothetical protein